MKRENDLILFFGYFFAKEKTNRRGEKRHAETIRRAHRHRTSHELNAKNERCVALVAALNMMSARRSIVYFFRVVPCCLALGLYRFSCIYRETRYQFVYSFRQAHFICNYYRRAGTQFERIQLQFLQLQQEGLRGGSPCCCCQRV